MKFSIVSVLALTCGAYAAISGKDVANSLQTMSDLSLTTGNYALEIFNGSIVDQLGDVIQGFDLITTASKNEAQVLKSGNNYLFRPPPPLVAEEQDSVRNAFQSFVRVHQELLKIIIGKKHLIASLVTDQIKTLIDQLFDSLVACSNSVTDLTNRVIPLVPEHASEITELKNSCDETIGALKENLQSY